MTEVNGTSLYDKVGGLEALRLVVDEFYERITIDTRLAHYFEHISQPRLRRHQVLFLAKALGGPSPDELARQAAELDGLTEDQIEQRLAGDDSNLAFDLMLAHDGLNITSEDYDLVVQYLVDVLKEANVSGDVIAALGAATAELKPSIVDNGSAVRA